MSTVEAPFEIGQTFWIASHIPRQGTIPCPICLGRRVVVVLIGEDERVDVDCEACGVGYEGPKGTITEWTWTPGAEPFVIKDIVSMSGASWRVRSAGNVQADFDTLYQTEADALAASAVRCDANHEGNMMRRRHRKQGVSKATWAIQYHRKCIADAERQIAWHRSKLTARPSAPQATAP